MLFVEQDRKLRHDLAVSSDGIMSMDSLRADVRINLRERLQRPNRVR